MPPATVTLPAAAVAHQQAQQDVEELTLAGAATAWAALSETTPGGMNWGDLWRLSLGPQLAALAVEAQMTAIASTSRYVTDVLAETGPTGPTPDPVDPLSLAGYAGSGYPVESRLVGSLLTAVRTQYQPEVEVLTPEQRLDVALAAGLETLEAELVDIVNDAVRQAEAVEMAQRDWVEGYYRMVSPEACSRCVTLAGRFYRYNEGFDRHPNCRCVHIPAAEADHDDLRLDPQAYFESLTRAEQDRVFTIAGAEAIRLGADITQVVNARRGMSTAQQNPRGWIPKGRLQAVTMFGRDVFVTTEGVTRRGVYGRGRGDKPVRLMPESILALADDRADALRLLRLYGYLPS